jgi:hypothetical protein
MRLWILSRIGSTAPSYGRRLVPPLVIRSLSVHELAVFDAIPQASVDARVVVIASTAVYEFVLSVGGLYAVVPAVAVEVVDARPPTM